MSLSTGNQGVFIGGGTGNVTTSGLTLKIIPVATTPTNLEDSTCKFDSATNTYDFTGNSTIEVKNITLTHAKSVNAIAPLITAGPALGVGGSIIVTKGTDGSGIIACTFGAAPVASQAMFSVIFNVPYGAPPVVLIDIQADIPATARRFFCPSGGVTALGFQVNTGTTIVGLGTLTFVITYWIIE